VRAYPPSIMRERTIVVGAGLSGLACAFDLLRAGHDVQVLEAADRAGGVVSTREQDGFLFEEGPSTVQASAESFRELAGDLGLAPRMLASERGAIRWLWFHGELVRLPSSLLAMATTKLLSPRAKLAIASEPLRTFVPPDPDALEPTFEAFLEERLGREATRLLAGAFVRGVYAAEIEELGAASAFPRMWKAASEHGGLVRGLLAAGRARRARRQPAPGPVVPRTSLISFPRGLQELVDALSRSLAGRLHLRAPVERIERIERGWLVVPTNGASFFGERVVLALPAPAIARVLQPVFVAGAQGRADLETLRRVKHARVAVVHLGFGSEVALPAGFGYLVPPDPEHQGSIAPRALGTIFTSNLFEGRAPEGRCSVSTFYRAADVDGLDDARLVDQACQDLALATRGPKPNPKTVHIRRWNDVIPRYEPGHARRVQQLLAALERELPGIELAGSAIAGLSVEHVIARGRAVARKIVRDASEGFETA
jgi:oxygen-dependent protoporphyrinogen oxidase